MGLKIKVKEEGGSFVLKFTFYQQENEKSAIETIHYLFFISLEDNLYLIDITTVHNQGHCLK